MDRLEKVATPPDAATVAVPESTPPEGLVPMARVTLSVAVVTRFPCASWMDTCTAGVIAAPAVVLLGCTENASFAAAPAAMLNALLAAPVRLAPDAVSV